MGAASKANNSRLEVFNRPPATDKFSELIAVGKTPTGF